MPRISTLPATWRPIRKNTVPKARPSSDPANASPAAIRRVIRLSEPTSRSAASRRSRRSPPNRTAAAMNTATGISSTTKTISTSRISTGSAVSDWAGCGRPNSAIRAVCQPLMRGARSFAPA